MLKMWHKFGFSTFAPHAANTCTTTLNIVKEILFLHKHLEYCETLTRLGADTIPMAVTGQEEPQPPPPPDMKGGKTSNKVHFMSQKYNPGF